MIDGLKMANAPQELIDTLTQQIEEAASEDCEIWPENAKTVQFFFVICKQWIISSMGDYLSLDHKAIESSMNMMGIPKRKRRRLLYEVGVMEEAALEVIKERKESECQR